MAYTTIPASSSGGSGLPAGSGLVKVTAGVGGLAVSGTDYDVPLAGAVVPIAADGASITISSFSGAAAGGVRITGNIQTGTVSGGGGLAAIYSLRPNSSASNTFACNGGGLNYVNKGLVILTVPTGVARLFNFEFFMPTTKIGLGPRAFSSSVLDSNLAATLMWGYISEDATDITSWLLTATYNDGSATVGFSNIIKVISGYTGVSRLTWAAQGLPS